MVRHDDVNAYVEESLLRRAGNSAFRPRTRTLKFRPSHASDDDGHCVCDYPTFVNEFADVRRISIHKRCLDKLIIITA